MLVLDESRVRDLLRPEALIPAMERALIEFSAGRVVQPVRTLVSAPTPGTFFAVMPAVYGDILGAKLVTVFPDNPRRGLPSHMATIQIFRTATGEPLATMDGRLITELRTAAVSAVAAKALARPDARVLAILGTGVQARAHVHAMRLVRAFDDIRVWGRTPDHVRQFAAETGARPMSAQDAVRGADVVVTVTGAAEPVLRGSWLSDGALVTAVGAVGLTRRELDDDTMRGAVIVDSRAAALQESGDVMIARATIHAELGEVLARSKAVPQARTIVFKSLGLAVEDLAAAQLVYEAATGHPVGDASAAGRATSHSATRA
jgi:ornithine cyclodeaminase/alanine dehydrogenase-like protein (mu-crystallin family)